MKRYEVIFITYCLEYNGSVSNTPGEGFLRDSRSFCRIHIGGGHCDGDRLILRLLLNSYRVNSGNLFKRSHY
jgi:hypothetical protein